MSPNTPTNTYWSTVESIVIACLVQQLYRTDMQEATESGPVHHEHSPSYHWKHLHEALPLEGGIYHQESPPCVLCTLLVAMLLHLGAWSTKVWSTTPLGSGSATFLRPSCPWTNLHNTNPTSASEHYLSKQAVCAQFSIKKKDWCLFIYISENGGRGGNTLKYLQATRGQEWYASTNPHSKIICCMVIDLGMK